MRESTSERAGRECSRERENKRGGGGVTDVCDKDGQHADRTCACERERVSARFQGNESERVGEYGRESERAIETERERE